MFYFNKLTKSLFIIFLISAILFPFNLFFKPVSAQIPSEGGSIDYPFSEPIRITINAKTNTAFILNRGNSEITIFDGETKKAIFNLPTGGKGSMDMLMDSSGNLYVLNQRSDNITVFPSFIAEEKITQDLINRAINERKFIPVGKTPIDLAYNRNLQKIYVLNSGDNTLSVIDKKTNQVTATLKLGRGASRIMVNSETNRIYAIHRGKDALFIIDGKTNKLINILSIGNRLFSLEMGANKIFVSSYGDDSIYIIDSTTDELITTIKSGGRGPKGLNLNETTKKLYVSNWLDNSLTVIDVQSLNLLKKISLLPGAYSGKPSINEETNQIFISNLGIRSVSVIDGNQDEIIATLETGVNPGTPLINLKTGEVYIPNLKSNSITIISRNAEEQFVSLTIPDQRGIVSVGENFSFPFRLAINEKANEIYVLNNFAGNFVILDGKTYEVKDKISVGENPREILFLPDLNKVFVSNGDEDSVTIYNTQDKSQKTISVGNKPVNLLFNPQTKKIYTINYDSYDVSVIDADKEIHLSDISLGGKPKAIAFNSKENKIYVAMVGNNEVVVINGETDQVLKRIKTEPKPTNLFFDKTFNQLYVGYLAGNDLTIIDGTTDQVVKTLAVGNSSGFLTSDETKGRIYVSIIDQNLIKVIDSNSLEIVPLDILTRGSPRESIIDLENQKLFVLTTVTGGLDIIDLEKNRIIHSLDISGPAASLAGLAKIRLADMVFNSKTNKLFIALGVANGLAVVDAKKNRLEAVIHNEGVERISYPLPTAARIALFILVIGVFIVLFVAVLRKLLKRKRNLSVSS